MKREAWEAMNNSVSSKYKLKVNHQIVTDSLVEDLHEAGFVIVPHNTKSELEVSNCIHNRQRSEQ